MRPTVYRARFLAAGGRLIPGGRLSVDAEGRVSSVEEGPTVDFGEALICPGFVNSHSHAFQVLLRGRSESAASFRDWVDRCLYPLVESMTPELVFESAALSFAEMLLEGVTSVGEFFYLNSLPGVEAPARRIFDAAEAVGIRLCLLRSLYDQRRRAAQERFIETPERAEAEVRSLCQEARRRGHGFGVAPHGLHSASPAMIRLGHRLAHELDCPMHIHVAEQRGDLETARTLYGMTPGRALDSLGVIDERLTCVHGVWLDSGEVELLGSRRAGLAYNPRSNMALGDGIAPIKEMLQAGVRVSLGIDGPCANNQMGILHEVRAAEALQRIRALEMNQLSGVRGGRPDPWALLEMGTLNGARSLGLRTGSLELGQFADFLVVDLNDWSLWPWSEREPEALLWNFLLGSSPRACIRQVFVGGRQVVRDGVLAAAGSGWQVDRERLASVGIRGA